MPSLDDAHEFGPDTELDRACLRLLRLRQRNRAAAEPCRAPSRHRHDIHAWRADEIADEGMVRPLEELVWRADLDDLAVIHDDHLVGEGERLGLIVGDVDHGEPVAAVELLQLRAQHPLHVRVDYGQRLVEKDRVDVRAHQPAAERDLLLLVRRQPARLAPAPAARGRSSPASRARADRLPPRVRRGS
jgi:hypothetical protein